MIERLIHTLQALAAPAAVQLACVPDFAASAGELALDYADALRLVTDCPQIQLEPEQRATLERLDEHLDRMSSAANAALWSEESIRFGMEWSRVRALARAALATLGASTEEHDHIR